MSFVTSARTSLSIDLTRRIKLFGQPLVQIWTMAWFDFFSVFSFVSVFVNSILLIRLFYTSLWLGTSLYSSAVPSSVICRKTERSIAWVCGTDFGDADTDILDLTDWSKTADPTILLPYLGPCKALLLMLWTKLTSPLSLGLTPAWWITLWGASPFSLEPHDPNFPSLSLKLSSEMWMDWDSTESIGFCFSTSTGSVMLQKLTADRFSFC